MISQRHGAAVSPSPYLPKRRSLYSRNLNFILSYIYTICAVFEAAGSPLFQPWIFLVIRQIDQSQREDDNAIRLDIRFNALFAQDIRLLSLNLTSTIPAELFLFLYSLFFCRFNTAKMDDILYVLSLFDSFFLSFFFLVPNHEVVPAPCHSPSHIRF